MSNNKPFWTEHDIPTNGIIIHIYRTGGDKPPLLLAHGVTDNGLCWSRFAAEMAAEYDVIMVDLRGHGRSEKPTSSYKFSDYAADLARLIETLDLGPTAVLGHSLGGAVAAILAATCPDLVSCAILEDPAWHDYQTEDLEESFSGLRAFGDWIIENQSQPIEFFIAKGREWNPTWAEEEFPAWAQSKQQVSANVFQLDVGGTTSWPEVVRQFQAPALLITADYDPDGPNSAVVSPAVATTAASLNPHLTVSHISPAGHNIRREQFEAFLKVVRDFLESVSQP